MVSKATNSTKPKRALSNNAKCPACDVMVNGSTDSLVEHFSEVHKRKPTQGEIYQFRSYRKKDFKSSRYKIGYFKSPLEVSGGLPSLGKRK